MSLPNKGPLPQPSLVWLTNEGQQALALYLAKFDALVAALAGGNVSTLTNAANDAAAATAGVNIGQLYRNGSQVMVRVS